MNQVTTLFLFHGVRILSQAMILLWIVRARQLYKDVESLVEEKLDVKMLNLCWPY